MHTVLRTLTTAILAAGALASAATKSVLIEAEAFGTHGGWTPDAQLWALKRKVQFGFDWLLV